jgi:hypothetical protein
VSVPDFVGHLVSWRGQVFEEAVSSGTALELGRSDSDRPKRGAWVIAQRGERIAQLTVWSSGEVEFEAGRRRDDVAVQEHYEVTTVEELDDLAAKLLAQLGHDGRAAT